MRQGTAILCVYRTERGEAASKRGRHLFPSCRAAVEQLGKNALGIWSAACSLVQERNKEILYGFNFNFHELDLNHISCANYRGKKKCKMNKDF